MNKIILTVLIILSALGLISHSHANRQTDINTTAQQQQVSAVSSTSDNYTPYFQTSVIWSLLNTHANDLQDTNANYLGTTYNITAMYAGMFLDNGTGCSVNEVTTADGAFNPLNYPYQGTSNWLSQFHGNVSLVIGGDPGSSGNIRDFLDVCQTPTDFANVVNDIMGQFNASANQPAQLVGIVFDVENASFHDGTAWDKIAAAIDEIKSNYPNVKITIAIPFNSSYWADAWSQAAFKTFFTNYANKIDEVNILDNDNEQQLLSSIQNYMQAAYSSLGVLGIPASKISMMLDTSESNLTPEVLSDVKSWLSTYQYQGQAVNQGIHLFSRDKDTNNLYQTLISN